MTNMKRMHLKAIAVAAGLAVAAVSASPRAVAEEEAWTVIDAGHLADLQGGRFVSGQQILIRGGRIEAIGAELDIPGEAARIDLSDAYVLPGLMDMHVHVFATYDEKSRLEAVLTQSSADNALIGLKNMQTLLHLGFTTVRMPGDKGQKFATISIKKAIERGDFEGPRMFVAPHFMGPVGGHGDLNDVSADWEGKVLGQAIPAGTASMQDFVRREIKYGADWIKIMATGGVMSQFDDPSAQAFSDEEFQALADETHRHDKKITAHAHAHGDGGAYAAVKAGFDCIEHGAMIEQRTIDLMVEKGTFLVPTVYVLDWILERGPGGGISANNYAKAVEVSKTHKKALRAAYKAGVNLALGSDSVFPHEQAIREFRAMADTGIANWDVLCAGTVNAARLLGIEEELGTLESGKIADIVAVRDDPAEDMRAIESVFFVMKEGRVVRDHREASR